MASSMHKRKAMDIGQSAYRSFSIFRSYSVSTTDERILPREARVAATSISNSPYIHNHSHR